MDAQDTVLATMNMVYKIQEIMNNNGWTEGDYDVIKAFPYLPTADPNLPLITVEAGPVRGKPVQLSSPNIRSVFFTINIYARTDAQRDDIGDIIFDVINDGQITFYDFNTGFPPSIGDYSGVSSKGTLVFQEPHMWPIHPSQGETRKMLHHHKLLTFIGDVHV